MFHLKKSTWSNIKNISSLIDKSSQSNEIMNKTLKCIKFVCYPFLCFFLLASFIYVLVENLYYHQQLSYCMIIYQSF